MQSYAKYHSKRSEEKLRTAYFISILSLALSMVILSSLTLPTRRSSVVLGPYLGFLLNPFLMAIQMWNCLPHHGECLSVLPEMENWLLYAAAQLLSGRKLRRFRQFPTFGRVFLADWIVDLPLSLFHIRKATNTIATCVFCENTITTVFCENASKQPKMRLLIATPQANPGSGGQLIANAGPFTSLEEGCHIFLGQPNFGVDDIEKLKDYDFPSGVKVKRIPGSQASAVVCDDLVCISSYAFLSRDSREEGYRSREVGIVLEGTRFSERIWNEFFPGQVPSAQANSEQRKINQRELSSAVAKAYQRPETKVSVEGPVSPWYSSEEILVVYIRDDDGWRFGVAKSCKDRAVLEAEQKGWDCMKDSKIWPLELLPRQHKLLQEANLISDGSNGPVVLASFADEKTTQLDTLSEIIAKPKLWERCESYLEAICNRYRYVTQIAYTEKFFDEDECMMPGFSHMRNMVHPDLLKKLLGEFDWKEYTEYNVDPQSAFRLVAGKLCPNSLFALVNESIWQNRRLVMPYIPIHGDLNPGNVIFRRADFSFVLIDFGKKPVSARPNTI